jgi:hypothetical protein
MIHLSAIKYENTWHSCLLIPAGGVVPHFSGFDSLCMSKCSTRCPSTSQTSGNAATGEPYGVDQCATVMATLYL